MDRRGTSAPLVLDDPRDAGAAALLLASGAAVAHGFANIYAITATGDDETVRRVNALKGRPADQVGSLTTPPDRVLGQFDLARLSGGLTVDLVMAVVDALQAVGPVGFRGPAASHVPACLTSPVHGMATTQVIVPGVACPSATFLERAWAAVGGAPLFITSANRSRHVTGEPDAPAHWRAAALREEFSGCPGLVFLEHADEALALARFPRHLPMSTTIIGFDHPQEVAGRICLSIERHGSLAVQDVCDVLTPLGIGATVSPAARERLRARTYPRGPARSVPSTVAR